METNEDVETFTFDPTNLGVLDDLPTDFLYQLVEQLTDQVHSIKGEERADYIQREVRMRAIIYALILLLSRTDLEDDWDY